MRPGYVIIEFIFIFIVVRGLSSLFESLGFILFFTPFYAIWRFQHCLCESCKKDYGMFLEYYVPFSKKCKRCSSL